MRIIRVRPHLNPRVTVVKGNLFLASAIEDPALRPHDEVESDYDGMPRFHGLLCASLMQSVGHYKRLDADGLFQTILTKLSPRSKCPQVLHYSVRLAIGPLDVTQLTPMIFNSLTV